MSKENGEISKVDLLHALTELQPEIPAMPSSDDKEALLAWVADPKVYHYLKRLEQAMPDMLVATNEYVSFAYDEEVSKRLVGDVSDGLSGGRFLARTDVPAVPTAVIEINGGLVNCIRSSVPMQVVLLDEDTEGGDEDSIHEVNGESVYVHNAVLHNDAEPGFSGVDRGFVENVLSQIKVNAPDETDFPQPN